MSEDRLVVGVHAVLAVLRRNPTHIEGVWLKSGREDARLAEVEREARASMVPVYRVEREVLEQMSGDTRHQGVVAQLRIAEPKQDQDFDDFLESLSPKALLLVLDGVQDPHNFGACLRSAEAAGVHGVLVPRDNSAPLSAVARKAASGAAEAVPLFRVPNLARALRSLKERNVWVIGATHDADQTLYQTDLAGPTALVLGGEGKGLRRLTREHCDLLVRIPMAGDVASLNVSVATGICLFEAVRQRQPR